ncbi:MAG: hypothetical protein A3B68_07035 [Candidatus Melainabacteria bacterium RIFCSPHIGHO2_02_FULL_34_12]|nr:MAG: hypothetical protein A3B68_07035 [Candidatus Melainabacteria bacterium RIFCSPHIGHO2_02_FULL_34_12]
MEKNLFTFNFKLIPKGFLIFLVFVLAFEAFIYFLPPYLALRPPYGSAYLKLKEQILDKKNDFDLIIFGDCTSWTGIKPVLLNKELSVSSYNFSVNEAHTYLMSYLFLKRYLSNCTKKPKIVILSISPNSLLGNHKVDLNQLNKEILPYFDTKLDLMNELNNNLKIQLIKHRILTLIPSIKKQFILKERFQDLYKYCSNPNASYSFIEYFKSARGFYDENLNRHKSTIKKAAHVRKSYKSFTVSEYNLLYMEKMLSLLAEQNIEVIVCTNSVRADEMKMWNAYDLKNKLFELINLKLKPHKNVIAILDMLDAASDKDNFADEIHLNSNGATIYTNELASRLKPFIQ